MAKHEQQAYERLGAKVLTLPDVIAQSVGFMGPVFSSAFVIPLVVGVISASGKGGGVASPLSVLIAAVGVFAIGAIVSRYAKEVHAAGSLYDYVTRGLGERTGTAAGWLYYVGVTVLMTGLLLLIGGYLESTIQAEFKVDPLPAWAWTLLVIALIAVVLYFGVRVSVRSQLVLALVSIVVVTIFLHRGHRQAGFGQQRQAVQPVVGGRRVVRDLLRRAAQLRVLPRPGPARRVRRDSDRHHRGCHLRLVLQGHQPDHLRALDRAGRAGDRLRLHLRHPGQAVREQRAERPDQEHRVTVSAVLVTGGGTGIGAAVARVLREAGDEVAILGRRPEAVAAVAASTGALDVVCDVSDAGQVSGAMAVVVERFGRLDGLVLNAGVMVPGGISELSLADWDALVSVNLTGAFMWPVVRCLPCWLRGGRSCRWRR